MQQENVMQQEEKLFKDYLESNRQTYCIRKQLFGKEKLLPFFREELEKKYFQNLLIEWEFYTLYRNHVDDTDFKPNDSPHYQTIEKLLFNNWDGL